MTTPFGTRHSDQVSQRFAAQRAEDVEPELLRVADPGPGALPGVVRGQGHVARRVGVEGEERVVERQRFLGVDVERERRRAGRSRRARDQRGLVDQLAAGGVDEERGRFHQADLARADDAVRSGRSARVGR